MAIITDVKKVLEFSITHKYQEFQLVHNQETYKLIKFDSTLYIFIKVDEKKENISFKELTEKEKSILLNDTDVNAKLSVYLGKKDGLYFEDIRHFIPPLETGCNQGDAIQ